MSLEEKQDGVLWKVRTFPVGFSSFFFNVRQIFFLFLSLSFVSFFSLFLSLSVKSLFLFLSLSFKSFFSLFLSLSVKFLLLFLSLFVKSVYFLFPLSITSIIKLLAMHCTLHNR